MVFVDMEAIQVGRSTQVIFCGFGYGRLPGGFGIVVFFQTLTCRCAEIYVPKRCWVFFMDVPKCMDVGEYASGSVGTVW